MVKKKEGWWPLIPKEEFFKLLATLLIVVCGGAFLTSLFQSSAWEREVQFEFIKSEIEDSRSSLRQIVLLIDSRQYASSRVLSNLADGGPDLKESWDTYMDSVSKWNQNASLYQTQLANFSNWTLANQFLADADDQNLDIPASIHYKFVMLHDRLLRLRYCYYSGCADKKEILQRAQILEEAITQQKGVLIAAFNEAIIDKYKTTISAAAPSKFKTDTAWAGI